jgi:hypothetical protein
MMMGGGDGQREPVEWADQLSDRRAARDPVVAFLAPVGARGSEPLDLGRVVAKLETAPLRPLVQPGARRRPGVYALYLGARLGRSTLGKASREHIVCCIGAVASHAVFAFLAVDRHCAASCLERLLGFRSNLV